MADVVGLRPTKKVGEGYNNAGFATYKIASGYSTEINEGDPVVLSSGTLVKATNASGAIGVFVGAEYENSEGQPTWNDTFPAGTTGDDIKGKVTLKEDQLFLAATSGEALAQADVGGTFELDLSGTPTVDLTTSGSANKLVKVEGVRDVPGNAVGGTDVEIFVTLL